LKITRHTYVAYVKNSVAPLPLPPAVERIMFMYVCRLAYVCQIVYELRFTFLKISPCQSWRVLLDTASIFALFSLSGFKDERLIKSISIRKMKHANCILECFEYFCQILS